MPTDAELLLSYVKDRSETAFAELVRRHLNLVYSSALRRTGGRHMLAEEISQEVFSDLANKAARLIGHSTLSAWLHRSTRYAAIDAIRRETRREKLSRSFTAMHDDNSPPESSIDWASLRPVVDDALDQLKERDRELMLLRFFEGLTFSQVGTKLNLTENAARMRTERALEKLRFHLATRGVTSTAGVLVGLLTNQSLVAAPPGLAGTVATAAIAAVPAGSSAGIASLVFMSKFTAPAVSATLAAGLTAIVWTSTIHDLSAQELSSLRAENARLTQAAAPNASEAAVAAVADEFSAQATAIMRSVTQRRSAANTAIPAAGANPTTLPTLSVSGHNGHRNLGQATPHDAFMSFAWAADAAEIHAMARLLTFDEKDRGNALAVLASMPDSIRAQYHTPEELYAFFFVADALVAPPPGADVIENFEVVPLHEGRVTLRRPGTTRSNGQEYQQTPEGWKYVIPAIGVKNAPNVLNNQTLAKLTAQ